MIAFFRACLYNMDLVCRPSIEYQLPYPSVNEARCLDHEMDIGFFIGTDGFLHAYIESLYLLKTRFLSSV
jgi:hypothetical protein